MRASLSTSVRAVNQTDRKSTRLNSSHLVISYAVFCLKKKNEFTNANSARLSEPIHQTEHLITRRTHHCIRWPACLELNRAQPPRLPSRQAKHTFIAL